MDTPIPEFDGRTFAELEFQEHPETGQLMAPEVVRVRRSDGSLEEVKVWLRVPRPAQYFAARKQAKEYAEKAGIDREADSELFNSIEQICIIANCARDKDGAQAWGPEQIADIFDEGSLEEVIGKLNSFKQAVDPRHTDEPKTPEEVFALILAIRRAGSLRPLIGIVSHEQPSWLLSMVREACLSPRVESYAQSLENSTPEPSQPES